MSHPRNVCLEQINLFLEQMTGKKEQAMISLQGMAEKGLQLQ